jgi:hypothetical protein
MRNKMSNHKASRAGLVYSQRRLKYHMRLPIAQVQHHKGHAYHWRRVIRLKRKEGAYEWPTL